MSIIAPSNIMACIASGVGSLGGGIYAYATEPSFTGLKGAFAAVMTGGGTGVISGVGTCAYALAGGFAGAALGSVVGKSDTGSTIGAFAAGAFGAFLMVPQAYGVVSGITVHGMEHQDEVSITTQSPEVAQAAHQLEHGYTLTP